MDYTDRMQFLRNLMLYILIAVVVAGIFNGCWYVFFTNWRHML